MLFALVAVFAIVALTLRVAELRPFAVLIVVLAMITALGTIYEKKTGYNVFYETAANGVLADRRRRTVADRNQTPTRPTARPTITGPTRHALSVTSILGMALPFAVVLAAIAPAGAGASSGASPPA